MLDKLYLGVRLSPNPSAHGGLRRSLEDAAGAGNGLASASCAIGVNGDMRCHVVKYSGLLPKLIILACAVCLAPSSFALDEFGDPSPLVTQSTDGESPDTRILAIQETEQQGILLISYQVESALDGLDHVELYFRKNGFESFSRYTEPTTGNPQGHFYPEVNGQGTILFDSTRRGGDGEYAFYTKTGDRPRFSYFHVRLAT